MPLSAIEFSIFGSAESLAGGPVFPGPPGLAGWVLRTHPNAPGVDSRIVKSIRGHQGIPQGVSDLRKRSPISTI